MGGHLRIHIEGWVPGGTGARNNLRQLHFPRVFKAPTIIYLPGGGQGSAGWETLVPGLGGPRGGWEEETPGPYGGMLRIESKYRQL
ncbi:hypothetical protein SUGI_1509920 [Cryptomeria japonica]|uniref:Uncharacterized protein n=1 Tax=Cryptomeria japonica TaxID=3369 RepID=A0AAD3NVV6_CRYJA|nr:hypothetical protein SUGI_1509920 [Cryptomeria japonica]